MKKDIVFTICQQMLAASPEASYKRLNPALRSTLDNCIAADLPFQPDTFRRLFNELRGHWWFGDGAGSHVGEHFYSHAVEVNHASAYQSFERFADRPAVLWEEDAKIPVRLHVGSRFTWKGYYVDVTSMRQDSLVACTYKDIQNLDGIRVGGQVGSYNKPHVITSSKRVGDGWLLRVIKSKQTDGDRTVVRRFVIRYDEIAELRKTERMRVKKILAVIAECDPAKEASKLSKQISAEHFRHFQLEEINAAFAKRKEWIAGQAERDEQAQRIEQWRNGINGAWLAVKSVLLRVRGDLVECSNGNSVSVAAVRRVLPIILDRRNSAADGLGLPLDGHTINSVNRIGVKVGCTTVHWSEVEYLHKILK